MTVANEPPVKAMRSIAVIALSALFVFAPIHDWSGSEAAPASVHSLHIEGVESNGHGAALCALAMLTLGFIGLLALARRRSTRRQLANIARLVPTTNPNRQGIPDLDSKFRPLLA